MSIENKADKIVWNAYQMYSGKPKDGAEAPFAMYSYNSVCYIFWKGFIRQLLKDGLNEDQVESLLQSKHMRWMFDCDSDQIEELAENMAKGYAEIALTLE